MENPTNTAVVPAAPKAAEPSGKVSDVTKLVTRMIDTVYSDAIFPTTVTPEQKHFIRNAFVATALTKLGL